jgi:hypothetical protein
MGQERSAKQRGIPFEDAAKEHDQVSVAEQQFGHAPSMIPIWLTKMVRLSGTAAVRKSVHAAV